jgi:hypothetical protein
MTLNLITSSVSAVITIGICYDSYDILAVDESHTAIALI